MAKFSQFMNDESGATAIEYGLIAAILSVGIIGVLGNVSSSLNTTFSTISGELAASGTTN